MGWMGRWMDVWIDEDGWMDEWILNECMYG